MNHLFKFNLLLLTKFVCLYSFYRLGKPSVAPSSAGQYHVRQLFHRKLHREWEESVPSWPLTSWAQQQQSSRNVKIGPNFQ